MHLLKTMHNKVNKLILCGIPGVLRIEVLRYNLYKNSLKLLPADKILVIQNEKDPFGNSDRVKKFIHSVDLEIKVIPKPRSDHDYPYFEDFLA